MVSRADVSPRGKPGAGLGPSGFEEGGCVIPHLVLRYAVLKKRR